MPPIQLSLPQVRKIILHAAGLTQPAPFGSGPEAVYKFINHLGYVQIDTNYVVERAHHHAIFSRVPDYQVEWLAELQQDGQLFEYLTSDAGFIPMPDFRFSLPVKESFVRNRKPMSKAVLNLMGQVLDRIGREGPLMVTDFENDRTEASTGWWDWRPSKVALERLYLEGELMISRTPGFKKQYDLPINIIPYDIDTSMPSPKEFAQQVILRNLKAMGIASLNEISWRARFVKPNLVKTELADMVAEGRVCMVNVDGIKTTTYMLPEYVGQDIEISGMAYILSPFDSVNVFRRRLKDYFGFDYQIECFVPQAKRKYGYFSLPVLVGDQFVARMDTKADRKNKTLIIHNLHFEEVKLKTTELKKVTEAIKAFTLFNQCRDVIITRSNHEPYLTTIRKGL
ncbi:winged helix-turn-helix domain-containing protein [Pedobacter sp. AW31-3R]|uniref:winged helix-turn-helix domain-containing protein n=1 Tax=Pedobacter sp. AW31-3R TaxID=3445781 RepID=UPI003FA16823